LRGYNKTKNIQAILNLKAKKAKGVMASKASLIAGKVKPQIKATRSNNKSAIMAGKAVPPNLIYSCKKRKIAF
jgi:hypothetical protein